VTPKDRDTLARIALGERVIHMQPMKLIPAVLFALSTLATAVSAQTQPTVTVTLKCVGYTKTVEGVEIRLHLFSDRSGQVRVIGYPEAKLSAADKMTELIEPDSKTFTGALRFEEQDHDSIRLRNKTTRWSLDRFSGSLLVMPVGPTTFAFTFDCQPIKPIL
jgi:hypothetical protein